MTTDEQLAQLRQERDSIKNNLRRIMDERRQIARMLDALSELLQ